MPPSTPEHVRAAVRVHACTTETSACPCVLAQLGEEKMGPGQTFVFKSRKKHNVYKECSICQERRLAVAGAISSRQPRQVIVGLKKLYAEHLQWMIKQRHVLDQITWMGMNEGKTVEDGDKCGDSRPVGPWLVAPIFVWRMLSVTRVRMQ